MKVTAKIWYPYIDTMEKEIEVDVPDDEDPDEWLQFKVHEILVENGADEYGLSGALDVDYAGIKLVQP